RWLRRQRAACAASLHPRCDGLLTLPANPITALPHQIDLAQRVLRDMGGRAILADEVGLGKTLEASIIYKELAIRGLARRVLILTPASLVGQRQGQPGGKFSVPIATPVVADDLPAACTAIILNH